MRQWLHCRIHFISREHFKEIVMKHRDKIAQALKVRQDNAPNLRGFHTPGSMNRRKTGYFAGKRH